MTPLQQARIVTLDDVGVEVLVESASVTTPPPSVIQSEEDELEFKTQNKELVLKKSGLTNLFTRRLRMAVFAYPSRRLNASQRVRSFALWNQELRILDRGAQRISCRLKNT